MSIGGHPVVAWEARVALTLRLLCGLTTEEIAQLERAAALTKNMRERSMLLARAVAVGATT